MQIHAKTALLPEGWAADVALRISKDGRIAEIRKCVPPAPDATLVGALLPAPANAHSHGFQRAMAGLTERRGPRDGDSFWTWRTLMYRFLDQLDPDDIEAITAFVQMEMLEAGYATNVEFHYLHHQPGGRPYGDLSELSTRIAAASQISGIGLTLLPVHYQYAGCDGGPLGPGQIRFGNDRDGFARLLGGAARAVGALQGDAVLGVAPHSLRAVAPADLRDIAALAPSGPCHMHLAEQVAEVDEVLHHRGARPVAWALENMPIDDRWCLIHCTQMTPSETTALARSGAIAGLCPITESSLGDGIFDGVRWLEGGGAVATGSDSNLRISLSEELRTLDYSQRLRDHSRAALATPTQSTGRRLFAACVAGGARAAGRDTGRIAPGMWADLMALDMTHVDLATRSGDMILDTYIFAGDDRMVRDVWSAGRHMVQEGRHVHRAAITAAYARTLHKLTDQL